MTFRHKALTLALVYPVAVLALFASYRTWRRIVGVEVVIPIAGYDPRDLLAGHYLTYRLDFGTPACASGPDEDPVFVCVSQERGQPMTARVVSSVHDSDGCHAVLRGRCHGAQFAAGVERFYVPEEHSAKLDSILRRWGPVKHRTELLLSVDGDGRAVVKDLLIDGQTWRKSLAISP